MKRLGLNDRSGGGAEPEVVVATRGRRPVGRAAQAAAVGGHPDPGLADLAQRARADDLDNAMVVFAGVDQIAHLGDASAFSAARTMARPSSIRCASGFSQ